ncbi:UNVERIFIED_CONTAM: hypothetical protein HDU68_009722 [Siphonaria sp. JEL0065]|nr:hypothetical protein HDU68_009722 [Siphonaria sp. JEL0065]
MQSQRVTGERKKVGRKVITEEPKSKRVAQNRIAQRLENKVQEQAARIEELEREKEILKLLTLHLEIQPCAAVLDMGFPQQAFLPISNQCSRILQRQASFHITLLAQMPADFRPQPVSGELGPVVNRLDQNAPATFPQNSDRSMRRLNNKEILTVRTMG